MKCIDSYILTSHDFSWLQKGQLNCVSNGTIAFLLGAGFLFDLRLPIFKKYKVVYKLNKIRYVTPGRH